MNLPIKKTILATLAFMVINWRKILEISIIPLLFSLPFILTITGQEFINLIEQIIEQQAHNLPVNILFYSLLFLYGYSLLSINLLRVVILEVKNLTIKSNLFNFKRIFKYILFSIFISFIILISTFVIKLFFIILVIEFLIVPLMLNFVNIAVDKRIKFIWRLPFVVHFNLFFMQRLLPYIIIFAALFFNVNFYVIIIMYIVIFYWTTINIALCYRIIYSDNK